MKTPSFHFAPARLAHSGQATVELLVAALFVLIPLFVAIAAMGKFLDVQHTADMAARYAAWERTVWYEGTDSFATLHEPNQKSAAAINSEVAARLLNDRSGNASVIKSSDKTATTLANGIDPMWHDIAGTAYLKEFDRLATDASRETPTKDVSGKAVSELAKVQINGLLSFVPPLPTDNLAVVKVSLKEVAKNSEVYKRLWSDTAAWAGLDFEANGAILSNTWTANSNIGTRSMVAKSVPTAQGLGAFIETARDLGMAPWDPMLPGRVEVGKINVDVVPKDRLK